MSDQANKIQPLARKTAEAVCGMLPFFSTEMKKACVEAATKKSPDTYTTLTSYRVEYQSAQSQSNAAAEKKAASDAPPTHDASQEKSAHRFLLPPWLARFFETPEQRRARIAQLLQESMAQFRLPDFARNVNFPVRQPEEGQGGAGGEGGEPIGGAGGAGGDEGVGGEQAAGGAGGEGGEEPVGGAGGAGGDEGVGGEQAAGGAGGDPVEPNPEDCVVDEDGDGYMSALPLEENPELCADVVPEINDCDDEDPFVHPGRPEGIGGDRDANCDGNNEPTLDDAIAEITGNPGDSLGFTQSATDGEQVIVAGDIIQDGVNDVVISSAFWSDPEAGDFGYHIGEVLVYSGASLAMDPTRFSPEDADVTMIGPESGAMFGSYIDVSERTNRDAQGRVINTEHTLHVGDQRFAGEDLSEVGHIYQFSPRQNWPSRVDFRETNINDFANGNIHGSMANGGHGVGHFFKMKDVGDFTGDGREDVLISAAPDTLILADKEAALANRSKSIDELPGVRLTHLTDQEVEEVEVGDFNNDGFTDVAVILPVEYIPNRGYATKVFGGRTVNGDPLPAEIDMSALNPNSEIKHRNYLGRNEGDNIGLAHAVFRNADHINLVLGGHNIDNGHVDSGGTFVIDSPAEENANLPNGSIVIVGDHNNGFYGIEINGDINSAQMPWSGLSSIRGSRGVDSLIIGGSNYGNGSEGLLVTITPDLIENMMGGETTIANATERVPGRPNLLLGARVKQIGDLNGDGLPELAVWSDGARGELAPGVTHIFLGK